MCKQIQGFYRLSIPLVWGNQPDQLCCQLVWLVFDVLPQANSVTTAANTLSTESSINTFDISFRNETKWNIFQTESYHLLYFHKVAHLTHFQSRNIICDKHWIKTRYTNSWTFLSDCNFTKHDSNTNSSTCVSESLTRWPWP